MFILGKNFFRIGLYFNFYKDYLKYLLLFDFFNEFSVELEIFLFGL